MTLKTALFLLSSVATVAIFSGCHAHSSHYTASYEYYEPAYVEEVYVERPVYYSRRGHHHGRRHCY